MLYAELTLMFYIKDRKIFPVDKVIFHSGYFYGASSLSFIFLSMSIKVQQCFISGYNCSIMCRSSLLCGLYSLNLCCKLI